MENESGFSAVGNWNWHWLNCGQVRVFQHEAHLEMVILYLFLAILLILVNGFFVLAEFAAVRCGHPDSVN